MSDEGVYRTALASPALLNNTKASALEHVIRKFHYMQVLNLIFELLFYRPGVAGAHSLID